MKTIVVAGISTSSHVGKIDENLANVKRWAERAKNEGAELLCFPELGITGFWSAPDIPEGAAFVLSPSGEVIAETHGKGVSEKMVVCELRLSEENARSRKWRFSTRKPELYSEIVKKELCPKNQPPQ